MGQLQKLFGPLTRVLVDNPTCGAGAFPCFTLQGSQSHQPTLRALRLPFCQPVALWRPPVSQGLPFNMLLVPNNCRRSFLKVFVTPTPQYFIFHSFESNQIRYHLILQPHLCGCFLKCFLDKRAVRVPSGNRKHLGLLNGRTFHSRTWGSHKCWKESRSWSGKAVLHLGNRKVRNHRKVLVMIPEAAAPQPKARKTHPV